MDKKVFYRTVAFIRKQFLWSAEYRSVKKRCQILPFIYKCEGCEGISTKDEEIYLYLKAYEHILDLSINLEGFQVDHIDPVGTLDNLDQAYKRIFCDLSNLMGLCNFCHTSKTMVDKQEIAEKKTLDNQSIYDKLKLSEN